MNDYFKKNLAIFSPGEIKSLEDKHVFVAGCGGLGGSVIELLVRSGIGHLSLADMDRFEDTNMNRQILCTVDTLGKSKAETARLRALQINPSIDVRPYNYEINENNARNLISGCDLVIDALDSISARLVLEDACAAEGIHLVHGAVKGWALQTGICPPGANILHKLYAGRNAAGPAGGIAMTIFTCASFQVSEAVKYLLKRPDTLIGSLMFFDLLSKESQIIPF